MARDADGEEADYELTDMASRRGVASSVSVDDEDAGGGAEIGGAPLERRPVGRSPGADRTRPAGGSSL